MKKVRFHSGRRLAEARQGKGKTQEYLASDPNFPVSCARTIGRWENQGVRGDIQLVAEYFSLSPRAFIDPEIQEEEFQTLILTPHLESEVFEGIDHKKRAILKGNVDTRTKANPETNFLVQVVEGDQESVIQEIQKGIDINQTNSKGENALMLACQHGKPEIVKILLNEEKLHVNAVDHQGKTALIHCSLLEGGESFQCALFLLEKQINRNAKDQQGWSVMLHAVNQGNLGLVKLLIQHKVSFYQGDKRNWTPLMEASLRGQDEMIKLFVKESEGKSIYGKSQTMKMKERMVNAQDQEGKTALMAAVYRGNLEIVQFLLLNGADASLTSKDGGSAIRLAAILREKKIIPILLQALPEY